MRSSTAIVCLLHVGLAISALTSACGSSDRPPGIGDTGGRSGASGESGAMSDGGALESDGGAPQSSGGAPQSNGGSPEGNGGIPESVGGAAPESIGGQPDCARDGDERTTLMFVNGCKVPVTFRGSDIEGGVLAPGAATCRDIGSDVEELSAKRYWGFRGEDPGAEHHSLAEFTFNTDFNDFDWYNISYVDAFNLPLQISPLTRPKCEVLTCAKDLLTDCPSVGRFQDSHGELVACVSPERNDAQSPVARYFESCDDAYAWSGDDQNGEDPSPVRACAGEDWQISFCPEPP